MGTVLREYVARKTQPLEQRINELEQRLYTTENKIVSYEGVWQEGKAYDRGSAVTRDGSLWIAKDASSARPGDPDPSARSWVLAVKRGRA